MAEPEGQNNPSCMIHKHSDAEVTDEDRERLAKASQLNDFQRRKLEKDAKKNWDLFYKRNGDRFFKNRYWTRHEFQELFSNSSGNIEETKSLLEIGCGCGDFALPLLEYKNDESEDLNKFRELAKLFVYCCDISDKAIEVLKESKIYQKYHPHRIQAFVADITEKNSKVMTDQISQPVDFVSLVFVLSALEPINMKTAVENINRFLKPGGMVLFRDYAIYDKAMLRFNEGSKIANQFYVRQDGTRAYFFTKEDLLELFTCELFQCLSIDYVKRETINNSTKDKFSRIFLQAKFKKKKK